MPLRTGVVAGSNPVRTANRFVGLFGEELACHVSKIEGSNPSGTAKYQNNESIGSSPRWDNSDGAVMLKVFLNILPQGKTDAF